MNKQSLRHMKREATANALADAAFALALEKGLDGFVVEDVVQRAGYSRRTFANHYSCKEEAVAMAAVIFHGADEVEAWIGSLNEDMTLLDSLYQLMKLQLTREHIWKLRQLVSLSKEHKALEPYILSALRSLQITAQDTLSELSRGRYPNGYTHLLIGAVYGAVLPLLDGSLNVLLPGESSAEATEAITFDHYLDTMFDYLRKGF
ncbi:TetR/AcrR family transcriptional regulator [Paenibacillus arenilitoris]|uniref:TetR/AcrR family transcriptional regulator n=1 Tax=Paenibacillus arenilitoris TaxID=2772299 RepID=A0A927H526_9BACL|nr:TetR/AcrR family transcriptional regulator [Paenibacillus arenilitoris]MBD2867109.1 TetR/AcrR family transcriptional regulator [Paenibacillus arenilitoris]